MRQRSPGAKLLTLVLALQVLWLPLQAEPPTATLNGVIRSADRNPLPGARLLLADPETGEVFQSEPTESDGNFVLADLRPGKYEVAVAVGEGLYLVADPVFLVAGVTRTVQIAIRPATGDESDASAAWTTESLPSIWNRPLSAAFIVFGAAVLVGIIVENVTDDEISPIDTQ